MHFSCYDYEQERFALHYRILQIIPVESQTVPAQWEPPPAFSAWRDEAGRTGALQRLMGAWLIEAPAVLGQYRVR